MPGMTKIMKNKTFMMHVNMNILIKIIPFNLDLMELIVDHACGMFMLEVNGIISRRFLFKLLRSQQDFLTIFL